MCQKTHSNHILSTSQFYGVACMCVGMTAGRFNDSKRKILLHTNSAYSSGSQTDVFNISQESFQIWGTEGAGELFNIAAGERKGSWLTKRPQPGQRMWCTYGHLHMTLQALKFLIFKVQKSLLGSVHRNRVSHFLKFSRLRKPRLGSMGLPASYSKPGTPLFPAVAELQGLCCSICLPLQAHRLFSLPMEGFYNHPFIAQLSF